MENPVKCIIYLATLSENRESCEIQEWTVAKEDENMFFIRRGDVERPVPKRHLRRMLEHCLIDGSDFEECYGFTPEWAADNWKAQYESSATEYDRLAQECRRLAGLPTKGVS